MSSSLVICEKMRTLWPPLWSFFSMRSIRASLPDARTSSCPIKIKISPKEGRLESAEACGPIKINIGPKDL